MTLRFPVAAEDNGVLLRVFLRRQGMSVALAASIKAAGGFWRAEQPIHTNMPVYAGDCITCALPPEKPLRVVPEALPLAIVYEDAHAMVLNKPAGQTVHPTLGYQSGTLAGAFCGEMARRDTPRAFRPVNRLDRNTSGLVLCAMNAFATPLLAKSAQKTYCAIVQGEMPLGDGEINAPIGFAEGSFVQHCVRADGKHSVTRYAVLAAGGGLSLVRVVPVTGRTHQIRVHFAHMGFPLAGDDFYGGETTLIARHALHCAELRFAPVLAPNASPCVLRAPLPQDMVALARRITPDSGDTSHFDSLICTEDC